MTVRLPVFFQKPWGGLGQSLVVACAVFLGGCGGESGPPRFHIAGNINYDGQPIPFGEIVFEPDGEAENKGPSTRLQVVNGAYSSKSKNARGTIGGAMVVRITGTDGEESGTQKYGAPLFKEHVEKVELPKEDSTYDFDVPKK